MVKQKSITVKQPELGQRIQELRKAKGLTQEELVNKCNINVRTIQRIEAGEVTPRVYTVKIILEALGYDLNTIQFQDGEESAPVKKQGFLKGAFFAGILYYVLAFVESFFDFKIWGFNFPDLKFQGDAVSFLVYTSIKALIFLSFSLFILGYYHLTASFPNALIKVASLILIGLTLLSISLDIYSYYTQTAHVFFLPVNAIAFGIVYVVFGIGMMKYRSTFGDLAFFGGMLGVAVGLCLMTLILVLPGLIFLAVFEIFQLVLLYRAFENGLKKDVPPASSGSPVPGV